MRVIDKSHAAAAGNAAWWRSSIDSNGSAIRRHFCTPAAQPWNTCKILYRRHEAQADRALGSVTSRAALVQTGTTASATNLKTRATRGCALSVHMPQRELPQLAFDLPERQTRMPKREEG